LKTVLGLQTELWALYVGALFVLTVMYFPGGLAGVLMMHAPAVRLGKVKLLVVPYVKTLVPAILGILAAAGFFEIMFHRQIAAVGEEEMTLYWMTFNSHSILPTAVTLLVAGVGFWLAKQSAPEMADAWHRSITPDANPATSDMAPATPETVKERQS
jgi:branched-chain amino acid transport system permease protein